MEPFWKGTFATSLVKHLKSVKLITLANMTQEDWDILDYENLRPSARYNLDKKIMAGKLYGFYKVSVDRHLRKDDSEHGGKDDYYFPTDDNGGDPSQDEFPTDWPGFDPIAQDEVPDPLPGYLALFAAFILLTPREQESMLNEIEAAAPDPEDELLDEAWLLWQEVPRVLTLLARAYRIQDRYALNKLLSELELTIDEINAVLNERE